MGEAGGMWNERSIKVERESGSRASEAERR